MLNCWQCRILVQLVSENLMIRRTARPSDIAKESETSSNHVFTWFSCQSSLAHKSAGKDTTEIPPKRLKTNLRKLPLMQNMILSGFVLTQYAEHFVMYELKPSELSVPAIQSCLRVDSDLHVKLFCKGSPIKVSEWFRKRRDCRFTRRCRLQNLVNYAKLIQFI